MCVCVCFFFHLCIFYYYYFLRILNIFNTHTGRGKKILKKLTVVYIQKGLILEYTAQTLNLTQTHFPMWDLPTIFSFENTKYFKHTHMGRGVHILLKTKFLSKLVWRETLQTFYIFLFWVWILKIQPLNFMFLMFLKCISNFVQIGYYLLFD